MHSTLKNGPRGTAVIKSPDYHYPENLLNIIFIYPNIYPHVCERQNRRPVHRSIVSLILTRGMKVEFSQLCLSMQQTSQVCSPARSDFSDQNNKHTFVRTNHPPAQHLIHNLLHIIFFFFFFTDTANPKNEGNRSSNQWALTKLQCPKRVSSFFSYKIHM